MLESAAQVPTALRFAAVTLAALDEPGFLRVTGHSP
jgi:hypothetical protein